uniref:Large ribosomal subunit protein uL1m n=1 Tax=Taeniopygia guttata TaxID=59729 RepID=A0A674GTB2_TAEGU
MERGVLVANRLWAESALSPRCGRILPGLEQRLAVPAVVSSVTSRPYAAAAAKTAKKDDKRSRQVKEKEKVKEKPRPRRRPLMSKPVDDVYLTWLYRRPSYGLEQAVAMLKRFQELDFTHPKQFVYINVFLDMALQKKKKVEPFSSGVTLPHRFTDEVNKVLVFTENEQEAEVAREHGAAIVGGVELIKWILEDEIQADFYVAVPAIIPKLIPLRNKLKKKYPSTRKNSLGSDIPKMVQFFRECHQYTVEDESVIKTRIARLDMPTEHIIANLKTIIHDICTFKPSNLDPIVQRLVIRSSTSEGLQLNLDGILPQVEKVEEKEEENAGDEDQQKPAQESDTKGELSVCHLQDCLENKRKMTVFPNCQVLGDAGVRSHVVTLQCPVVFLG